MKRKMPQDPRAVLASAETLKRIEDTCRRHFSDENESIQCIIYIIDALKAREPFEHPAYWGPFLVIGNGL